MSTAPSGCIPQPCDWAMRLTSAGEDIRSGPLEKIHTESELCAGRLSFDINAAYRTCPGIRLISLGHLANLQVLAMF